ncbi:hypothetical protein HNQ05_001271 [Oceanithermus desulfurans]|uniref:Uncharacterized protein n=2 Tax=Oceanithermus desulfurans TaxID=227924 RepID=A0A511RJN3_9DEIN|nr:hypothetical protein [Oceanithermus desulfurans]GEM89864.1 hypothetical protein ODE01S_12980 [Oceanithermus desulfurans NBRC 100063]
MFQSYWGPDGDFNLVGLTAAMAEYQGQTLLIIEPLGDILDALDVAVEYAGEPGGLGVPTEKR